ncbi:unnamed protein product [Rhizoctonia solani]|uniref:Uncharacterized protein n=1 Tax=Rhizoctonia solani TaxID=456999 RepID=A0A8H3CWV3_9AGAM|nr:unnamed protein product [Rhizoctonia solani]
MTDSYEDSVATEMVEAYGTLHFRKQTRGMVVHEMADFLLKFIVIGALVVINDGRRINGRYRRGRKRKIVSTAPIHAKLVWVQFLVQDPTANALLFLLVKEHSQHTIGVEFSSRTINIGEKRVKLQLWDTAGQERFRSVTRSYYRGAAACLLVYDITSRASFLNLSRWLADARALASPQLIAVLVGNKTDREEEREVEWNEASKWASENDVHFIETSSLTGDNIEKPFALAARAILLSIESGQLDPEKVRPILPSKLFTRADSFLPYPQIQCFRHSLDYTRRHHRPAALGHFPRTRMIQWHSLVTLTPSLHPYAPTQAGSGVSYGDRQLRRIASGSRLSFSMGSVSSGRGRKGIFKLTDMVTTKRKGKCC